ncbi:hypothetical protein UK99_15550, partial [Frankia casuarinae]
MSLTPPVLLMVLGFPLFVMAGMLMMGGIEKRLIGSRGLLSLVTEDGTASVGDSGPSGARPSPSAPAALSAPA